MLKRGQPSLYKLKEGRVNEECSCEQEHLLDEWTCGIGELNKWDNACVPPTQFARYQMSFRDAPSC